MTDIWLKDSVNDLGPQPYTGNDLAASPDILVYQTSQNPGAQANLENEPPPAPQDVKIGQTNFLYLRIRNRDKQADATNVSASVYWSEPGTLSQPTNWHLIDTLTNITVPIGTKPKVVEFQWLSANLPSSSGHYCFVAAVHTAGDPGPGAPASISFTNFQTWVKDHNNVSWRNFDVVPMNSNASAQRRFNLPGDPREALPFEFVVQAALPEGAQLQLEVPAEFARGLTPQRKERLDPKSERVLIELSPFKATPLGQIQLPAKSNTSATLHVHWPKEVPPTNKAPGLVWMSQLYRGREIGRITWEFRNAEAYEKRVKAH